MRSFDAFGKPCDAFTRLKVDDGSNRDPAASLWDNQVCTRIDCINAYFANFLVGEKSTVSIVMVVQTGARFADHAYDVERGISTHYYNRHVSITFFYWRTPANNSKAFKVMLFPTSPQLSATSQR